GDSVAAFRVKAPAAIVAVAFTAPIARPGRAAKVIVSVLPAANEVPVKSHTTFSFASVGTGAPAIGAPSIFTVDVPGTKRNCHGRVTVTAGEVSGLGLVKVTV